jgi:hypothetical protein
MNYLLTSESVVMFLNGKPTKVSKESAAYAKIIKALSLPASEQEAEILEILAGANPNLDIENSGFVIRGEEVFYKGDSLPKPLSQKILSLIKENLPVTIFEKFWENLKLNPAYHVVNEIGLYDFLSYRELPITDDGYFLAYRGIQNNGWSVSGNTATKVLQGKVDSNGKILNEIGAVIEVERNGVSDDRSVHCHNQSLHVGSLDYARKWGSKVVVVKVHPRDVVCAPNDCDSQKLRVCKFEVIAELENEIIAPAVTKDAKPVIDRRFEKDIQSRNQLIDRINSYLSKKKREGFKTVTVKAIQGIFSPSCPSQIEILDALQAAQYVWRETLKGKIVNL